MLNAKSVQSTVQRVHCIADEDRIACLGMCSPRWEPDWNLSTAIHRFTGYPAETERLAVRSGALICVIAGGKVS